MSLPDTLTPLGRRVDDVSIRKHCLTGRPPPAPHFFRRNLRAIVHQCFKGVLPEVEGREPMRDDSVEWYFSLRRTQDGGRQDWLAKARPMKRKGWVPREAVDALAAAVQNFETVCARGSQDSRDLRAGFTLPDPEKAPHMYRLYGPRRKPLLTCLWGFEQHKDETNSVPPARAVELLRKQQVPGWVILALHGVLKPVICLALIGLCAWYAPEGVRQIQLVMKGQAIRDAAPRYTSIADDAANNARASSDVAAAMDKIKDESLALKKELVDAQSKPDVSVTGFGGPCSLLKKRFEEAIGSKGKQVEILAHLETRAAALRKDEFASHFVASLKEADEEMVKAKESLANAIKAAQTAESTLSFITIAVDDPAEVVKLLQALAELQTQISDLETSKDMEDARSFYQKLSDPGSGTASKRLAMVLLPDKIEAVKLKLKTLPKPWEGKEAEIAKSSNAQNRVTAVKGMLEKLANEMTAMQTAVSKSKSPSSTTAP